MTPDHSPSTTPVNALVTEAHKKLFALICTAPSEALAYALLANFEQGVALPRDRLIESYQNTVADLRQEVTNLTQQLALKSDIAVQLGGHLETAQRNFSLAQDARVDLTERNASLTAAWAKSANTSDAATMAAWIAERDALKAQLEAEQLLTRTTQSHYEQAMARELDLQRHLLNAEQQRRTNDAAWLDKRDSLKLKLAAAQTEQVKIEVALIGIFDPDGPGDCGDRLVAGIQKLRQIADAEGSAKERANEKLAKWKETLTKIVAWEGDCVSAPDSRGLANPRELAEIALTE